MLLLGLQLQHHLLELHLLLLQNLVQTLQLLQDTQRPTLINKLSDFTSARGSDGVKLKKKKVVFPVLLFSILLPLKLLFLPINATIVPIKNVSAFIFFLVLHVVIIEQK